jgi:hypothetical protein
VKNIVHQETVQRFQEMRERITNVAAQNTLNVLENTCEKFNIVWTFAEQQAVHTLSCTDQ